ncbi:DinB family protein [Salaquimonas pukyongi]|uniref:DinB family protein n=1 Tax=Salaquimonas pukyongi TaxID=2712698 RepID=UPI00096B806E|nr:DinB family protein [Salaquimonas pukyongi]
MNLLQTFRLFAAYNRWANGQLYQAASGLDEKDYRRDCGAFFKSMHGTLNHVLVADRIWMKRFTGKGEHPDKLDAILFDDFSALREAREAEDARIIAWAGSLDEAAVEGSFTYTPVTMAQTITQKLAPCISHFFNHQTHHRGQAHTILSLLGHQPPSLDLIYFTRTDEGKALC